MRLFLYTHWVEVLQKIVVLFSTLVISGNLWRFRHMTPYKGIFPTAFSLQYWKKNAGRNVIIPVWINTPRNGALFLNKKNITHFIICGVGMWSYGLTADPVNS